MTAVLPDPIEPVMISNDKGRAFAASIVYGLTAEVQRRLRGPADRALRLLGEARKSRGIVYGQVG